MYRNLSYEVRKSDDGSAQGYIILFTWDENGNPVRKDIPHKSHLMFESPHGEHRSIYGDRLEKIEFESRGDLYKWKRDNPRAKCYDMFSPEQEFLIENYADVCETADFRKHKLRKQFIDIEVAVEEEFPEPGAANYPVNVLTVADDFLKEYHVWILEKSAWCKPGETEWKLEPGTKLGDVEWSDQFPCGKVIFHVFKTEYDFWCDYLDFAGKNHPDVITGWNIESFDIPYIYNRAIKCVGETRLERLSPIRTIRAYERKQRTKSGDRPVKSYEFKGVTVIDYLNLYENKFGPATAPSYKLNSVATEELGHGKLEYTGSIKEFYKKNFHTFVMYNIVDVMLVWEMDLKLKYIELARRICNMGLCTYGSVYSSSPYILGAIALEAKRLRGEYLMTDDRIEKDGIDVTFPGAFVFETRKGYYPNGVFSLDLNSLYPNIMINLNISPETKIGKIISQDDEFTEVYFHKKDLYLKIPTKDLADKFRGKFTISSNKIIYLNPEVRQGIIPSFLSRLYNLRRKTKDESIAMKKEIEENLEPTAKAMEKGPYKDELEKKIQSMKGRQQELDDSQAGFKTYLNSIYGQLGSKYFCLFDLDNAASVTLSGQTIIKESIDFINAQYADRAGPEGIVLAGDTDSNYNDAQYLVQDVLGSLPKGRMTKEQVQKVVDRLDNWFVPLVNQNCSRLTRDVFLSPLKNIEFKRESFCDVAAFLAKKNYVLHICNLEGVMKEKWKAAGVAIKKNELPPIIKKRLQEIIYSAMLDKWDAPKFRAHLASLWEEFRQMEPNTFAWNKGLRKEKKENGFMGAESGAGAHAKAAMFHNATIADLGLKNQYDPIRVGDVIRFAYIKPKNRYGISVIGWADRFPPEFADVFEIDYETMFEKVVMKPLDNFCDIFNWQKIHPAHAGVADVNDL